MQLVELLIYAFASTGLTLLLDFSFEKNHIFSFWLPFVSKLLNFKHYREIKRRISELSKSLESLKKDVSILEIEIESLIVESRIRDKWHGFKLGFSNWDAICKGNENLELALLKYNESREKRSNIGNFSRELSDLQGHDYKYWYELGQSNYLFYPLGFCVFCTSVWISFAFYSITHLANWNFFEMFLMSFLSFGFIYAILASKQ